MINALLTIWILAVPFGVPLTFEWQAPTRNTDGSQLTNLRQYYLYESVNNKPWTIRMGISPKKNTARYTPMTTGVYRFRMTAINSEKKESSPSNEIEVIIDKIPEPAVSPTPIS